ncbi:MAG: DUF5069 domain-containing protein [Candidatus Eremiobacteraeota bacterium]|nr:DUF5069 domain-containing protein [Candidatus Eremiobacteraeota bacterium]
MPTDFRDGKTFPRRGRDPLGEYLWLARVFDKARASANGTIFDYIYPCPMDQGVFERWGISPAVFDRAIAENASDDTILKWVQGKVSAQAREAANTWLLEEKRENLDRQDGEEVLVR